MTVVTGPTGQPERPSCGAREASAGAVFAALKAGLDARAAGRVIAAMERPFSSGFAELDRALGGGFARGALTTLEGGPSSGRTAIVAAALASGTRAGHLAGLVDDGTFYPPDLERAGVQLERTLMTPAQTSLGIARCADILLRSRAFAVLVMPAAPLRATVWSRLCGLAQKAGTVVFVLGTLASTELAYFASTRVRCAIERVLWSGNSGVLCELAGYEVHAHVLKHRRAVPGSSARLHIVDERISHGVALRSRSDISPVRSAVRVRRTGSIG
jgi:hypothetical protein